MATLLAVWLSRRAIDRFGIWPVGAATGTLATVACLATALTPTFPAYTVTVGVVMASEGAMTVVLRTLRARLIPAQAYGSTLAVTIILVLLPLPLAGALIALVPPAGIPHLLLACAAVQGLALSACFAGLRRHQAACAPPRPVARPVTGPRTTPAPLVSSSSRSRSTEVLPCPVPLVRCWSSSAAPIPCIAATASSRPPPRTRSR
ncbi:hypothetical protein [Streptomyces sp. NPDC088757]|uniref:hypothetical protein n=1 Tax=Streptomyces sp. NPDC088757 TaxID=3365889 RepID=UPI0038128210